MASKNVARYSPVPPSHERNNGSDFSGYRQYNYLGQGYSDRDFRGPSQNCVVQGPTDTTRSDLVFGLDLTVQPGHGGVSLLKNSSKPFEMVGLDGYASDFLDLCQIWTCPDPILLTIGTSQGPGLAPLDPDSACPIWNRCKDICERVFKIEPIDAVAAGEVNEGVLFQAINEGWSSLSLQWRYNPLVVILKEVDEFMFPHLDRIGRIAAAYKSLLLLKVGLAA